MNLPTKPNESDVLHQFVRNSLQMALSERRLVLGPLQATRETYIYII